MASKDSEGRKVRILMIVENCPYLRDPRVRREARTLVSAGYKVTVIAPNGDRQFLEEQTADNVRVYRFVKLPSSSTIVGHLLEYLFAMVTIAIMSAYVFLRDGFDIIHVANPPDGLVFIASAYKVLGKSVIYDQHDLCPDLYAAKFGDSDDLIARILRLLERLSFRLADAVIVTNESYKRLAMNRGRLDESVVTVVRNGPDHLNAKSGKIDPQLRRAASYILAFAGIMEIQDGVEGLIRTLHALRYKLGRNDFLCIVMGSGHSLKGVKALTRDLGLEDNVQFTGWISDRELYWSYLAASDICLAPEPFNEYNDQSTFVKVMEYMAAGKPIAAFDLKETRFSAQQSALYAKRNSELEFARVITKLMDDPGLRFTMGEAGRRLVQEKLAWQFSEPNLLKVYDLLASRYKRFQAGPELVAETKENDDLLPLNVLPEAGLEEHIRYAKGAPRE